MASLRIRNIGPIKDSGIIELTPFILLVGRQSSGKSTFMKVLCYCRWLEKIIMISPESLISTYTHNYKFIKELKQFHRLNDLFFNEESSIEYTGNTLDILYNGNRTNVKILKHRNFKTSRCNSKLCYIPAERNLISAVKNIDRAYKASDRDVLFNFVYEWDEGKESHNADNPMKLSVTDSFSYVDEDGVDKIKLPNGESIPQYYASSGLQSVAPIDVLSDYVTRCVGTTKQFSKNDLSLLLMEYLSDKNENSIPDASVLSGETAKQISRLMKYQSAQIFIEEPEQNLYPDAQRILVGNIMKRLTEALAKSNGQSMVVMTTHSPYVVSVLNVFMAEAAALEKMPDSIRLRDVIGKDALLAVKDFSAYFINHEGVFQDIKDMEVPMLSGNDLDGVSEWVDDKIEAINSIVYGCNE